MFTLEILNLIFGQFEHIPTPKMVFFSGVMFPSHGIKSESTNHLKQNSIPNHMIPTFKMVFFLMVIIIYVLF